MSAHQPNDDPWHLNTFWYELEGDDKERLLLCCGELLGSLTKFAFVRRELERTAELDDLNAAYDYLDYHIENYLTRLFAMRDRLLMAMKLLTGKKTCDLRSKDKDKRAAAAPRFAAIAPVATTAITELLDFMQDDIELRNMDTHETFFHIWLCDGNDVFEPTDVLLQTQETEDGPAVEARLRILLRRFVKEQCKKIELIEQKVGAFVSVAQGHSAAAAPTGSE